MEVTVNIIFEIAVIALATFVGFLAGMIAMKKRSDGTIIIEPTEEDDGERLIWKLDLELDDIKKRDQIVFKVENNTSQKSQSV
jgi:hypothetical protein